MSSQRRLVALVQLVSAALAACSAEPSATEPPADEVLPNSARTFGGDGYQEASAVAVGPNGEIAIAGAFADHFDFAGSSLAGSGSLDGFVLLIASDGSLAWQHSLRGATADAFTSVRFVGASIIVGGYAGRDTLLADSPLATTATMSALVASFALDGALEWSRTFAGDGYQGVASIAAGPAGGVVLAGEFTSRIELEDELTAEGSSDVFVAELDEAGDLVWGQAVAGTGAEHASSVTTSEGQVFVIGSHEGDAAATEDDEAALEHAQVEVAGFVHAFDASGHFLWSMSDLFGGAHTHAGQRSDGHASVEQPELLAASAQGIVGATRGELFGLHGEDFEAPNLGTGLLRGFDLDGQELWRTEFAGHDAHVRLAQVVTEQPLTRVLGSLSGTVAFGSRSLQSAPRRPYLVSLGSDGRLDDARLVNLAPSLSDPRASTADITTIAAATRADGALIAIATLVYPDGDRDVLLFELPSAEGSN
jgi:hypothetical protein